MSSRQRRRLQELREHEETLAQRGLASSTPKQGKEASEAQAGGQSDDSSNSSDSGTTSIQAENHAGGFAALLLSGSEADSDEEAAPAPVAATAKSSAEGSAAKTKKNRKKRKGNSAEVKSQSEMARSTGDGDRSGCVEFQSEQRRAVDCEHDDDEAALAEALQQRKAEEEVAGRAEASLEAREDEVWDCALAMRRSDFSLESERRRVLGLTGRAGAPDGPGSGNRRRAAVQERGWHAGRTAHHRRLYLVVPSAEERWPRAEDFPQMVPVHDVQGAVQFDFEESSQSSRCLQKLRSCLQTQDPEQLHQFLHHNPFCVDGLVLLADYHRNQGDNEQVYRLTRQAVYGIECGFHGSFSPFAPTSAGSTPRRPRTRLKLPQVEEITWAGWTWLRTLWLYMHALVGQGAQRAALEVCRLLLSTTLPRDPTLSLLFLDILCLQTRQYDACVFMARSLASQFETPDSGRYIDDLALVLPNMAFSVALAGILSASSQLQLQALREVSVADVIHGVAKAPELLGDEEEAPGKRALANLMRALLLFPLVLRPLLEEAGMQLHGQPPSGSQSRETWAQVLASAPFADAADFRHVIHGGAHARICSTYAKRASALWKADAPARWLHACATRLISMSESSVFAGELTAARATWSSATLPFHAALVEDYADMMPLAGGTVSEDMPPALARSATARVQPASDEDGDAGGGLLPGMPAMGAPGQASARIVPTISLHSPPLLVFFQSLMPWGELDRSGVAVEPLKWADVGHNVVCGLRDTWDGILQLLRWLLALVQEAVKEGLKRPSSR